MRFWITKNSELPVREQLARQISLAILSDDLPPGSRLPSIRALARRHRIHSNTVSAAYHQLLEQGWLELRKGSGLYVRSFEPPEQDGSLHGLLAGFLQTVRHRGFTADEVLRALEHLIRPVRYERVAIVEADPAMRAILQREISERIPIAIEAVSHPSELNSGEISVLVVALTSRLAAVRRELPRDAPSMPLRLRSVRRELETQARPPENAIISIASRSAEIRSSARSVLLSFGLDPESLCDIDPEVGGWRDRVRLSSAVVTDVVTAAELPAGCPIRAFHVIAESSLVDLERFCRIEPRVTAS